MADAPANQAQPQSPKMVSAEERDWNVCLTVFLFCLAITVFCFFIFGVLQANVPSSALKGLSNSQAGNIESVEALLILVGVVGLFSTVITGVVVIFNPRFSPAPLTPQQPIVPAAVADQQNPPVADIEQNAVADGVAAIVYRAQPLQELTWDQTIAVRDMANNHLQDLAREAGIVYGPIES